MTANIAIADSLKALDFNRPNREEPADGRSDLAMSLGYSNFSSRAPWPLNIATFINDLMAFRCQNYNLVQK